MHTQLTTQLVYTIVPTYIYNILNVQLQFVKNWGRRTQSQITISYILNHIINIQDKQSRTHKDTLPDNTKLHKLYERWTTLITP